MPVSAIILAAGSSSRMGQSKQLLPWNNETLLTHAIKTAMESRVGHIYVVLGSNAEAHKKAIEGLPVSVVVNENWEKGMGSSLKAGLKHALQSQAVLIMVCDQPFVTADHLNNLIEVANQNIVASKYLDAVGVPALFNKEMFDDLMNIGDEEGARKVILKHPHVLIVLPSGMDLDTPEDYRNALSD